jgi:NTP pyrophosphatase (non-canonical NTP hydrolase)
MKAFATAVARELLRARKLHPEPVATAHDAYGKILEEVQEFFDEVRQKESVRDTPTGKARMLHELIQVSSMAQRAAEDLKLI